MTAATVAAPRSVQSCTTSPLPIVRQTVRDLLMSSQAYYELDPESRRRMAELMVQVCNTAASLVLEEMESDRLVHESSEPAARAFAEMETSDAEGQPLARAQNAGDQFSGISANRVAGTTRAILNAVSFPRFVTELINGVFKAIVDSNMQQQNMYIELLNNVATSMDGFADLNMGADRARGWLVERFPGSFEVDGGDPEEPPDPEAPVERRIRMRAGGAMPSEAALRAALGIAAGESVPTSGDPDRTLVPLARRQLAKTRQEMLATMVQMGMQRIVIESGRINAAMRFHIDTKSAAQVDEGSRFDFSNKMSGSGSFGLGPWGASASMQNSIGYVSTNQARTTEEMNTDLELTSSVELHFKSDYLPLNRMASPGQTQQIQANSRNPDAEIQAARAAETARRAQQGTSDTERRTALAGQLTPQTQPALADGAPGTQAGADRARRDGGQAVQVAQPSQTGAPRTGGTQTGGTQTGGTQTGGTQTGGTQTGGTQTGGTQTGGTQSGGTQTGGTQTGGTQTGGTQTGGTQGSGTQGGMQTGSQAGGTQQQTGGPQTGGTQQQPGTNQPQTGGTQTGGTQTGGTIRR
jgi:hypothetical protein